MNFKAALFFVGVYATSIFLAAEELTKGHDLSSAALMEAEKGAEWISTSGSTTSIESILGNGGMNTVRLRLWTSGDYDLNYTLALAQRFSRAGYEIYLTMHFSDTWADPSKQAIPSSWDDSSVTALAADLQAYVSSTLKAFAAGDVNIKILSLGNEVTNGFLYPIGKINNDFSAFATLFKAAREGVNDAIMSGVNAPLVMIHLDNGWKFDTVSWFFESLFAEGTVTPDDINVFGFSFYNTEATIAALTSSLKQLTTTYNKPIYIAETNWPTECTSVTLSENYPVSAEGQVEWVRAIINVLKKLPNNLGAGLFYWEPGYLAVAGLGSACESALLFNATWDKSQKAHATALSSVNMFA